MPRGTRQPTGLAHIGEGALPSTTFEDIKRTLTFGPISVTLALDFDAPALAVLVELMGVDLANVVLNPTNPSATVGGSVAGFKAEVTVTVDFNKNCVTLAVEGCVPILGCDTWDEDWCW